MTIVAWDGLSLAADRMGSMGDTIFGCTKVVVRRNLAGGLAALAFTGNRECGLALVKWWESGCKAAEWPSFQTDEKRWSRLIVAAAGGGCIYYEQEPIFQAVEDPFMAWGVGREAALGAMAMGANAEKAVEIASRFVSGCGLGCNVMRVD